MDKVLLPNEPRKFEEQRQQLLEISYHEPEVAEAITMVLKHIHSTYTDKYAKGQYAGIDSKNMLYNKKYGHYLNSYQVLRYLQRYITEGSLKSFLVKDLVKAIHYIVFEITRRIKNGDVDMNEPKY